jgi:hypothetical protein
LGKGNKRGKEQTAMADDTMNNAICKGCGRTLEADEQDSEYCSRCMIERAEEYVPEAQERPEIRREKKSKTWLVAQLIIILIGVAIIALQTPRLIAALKERQPLRQGIYATDEQTDQCIKNLWHISRMLQDGKKPPPDMVCPVSNKPYEIRDTGDDIGVRCPNPALHGLKRIQASKKNPVPEISK